MIAHAAVLSPPPSPPPAPCAPANARSSLACLATAPWSLSARAAQSGFDALRAQHAAAVRSGLVPSSLRGSARFEQWVDTMEKVALGPLARRV